MSQNPPPDPVRYAFWHGMAVSATRGISTSQSNGWDWQVVHLKEGVRVDQLARTRA